MTVELATDLGTQARIDDRVENRGRDLRVGILVEVMTHLLDGIHLGEAFDADGTRRELGRGGIDDLGGRLAERVGDDVDDGNLLVGGTINAIEVSLHECHPFRLGLQESGRTLLHSYTS